MPQSIYLSLSTSQTSVRFRAASILDEGIQRKILILNDNNKQVDKDHMHVYIYNSSLETILTEQRIKRHASLFDVKVQEFIKKLKLSLHRHTMFNLSININPSICFFNS